MDDVLAVLFATIEERRHAAPEESYVAVLHKKGLDTILKKVGEEAVEMIVAAKNVPHNGDHQALINETADLCFHTLVMLSHLDLSYRAVSEELARRFGTSGIEEKQLRDSIHTID